MLPICNECACTDNVLRPKDGKQLCRACYTKSDDMILKSDPPTPVPIAQNNYFDFPANETVAGPMPEIEPVIEDLPPIPEIVEAVKEVTLAKEDETPVEVPVTKKPSVVSRILPKRRR